MSSNSKIESIQALRGLAALMVVFFHYGTLGLAPDNPVAIIVGHGWSGVDLFFVISGFIAAYTVKIDDRGMNCAFNYGIKRIAKIIPLYYLVTILSAGHSTESFINAGKSLLFIPIGGPAPDGLGPLYGGATLGQGWTLNYEMYFYLIVAISMAFGRAKWLFTVGFMLLSILIPVLLFGRPDHYGFNGFNFNHPYTGLITNPIIIEFLLGIAVYFIYTRMSSNISTVWYLFIVLIFFYFITNYYHPYNFTSRVLAWAVPSALLIISLLKLEVAGKIRFNKTIIFLGNISFSIYILHQSIHGAMLKVFKKITGNDNVYDHFSMKVVLFISSFIITLYLSSLSYKYIEKRLSDKFRKYLMSKNKHHV